MDSQGFLGIDVSKGYADFILINTQQEIVEKPFRLVDNGQGRKKLLELVDQWREMGLIELFCGVESTGGYENNWHSLLKGLQSLGGVYAARLNPKAVKAVSDAVLRRTITDSVSSENIALYLAKFPEKVDYGLHHIKGEKFKAGRDHLTAIQLHIKQRTQLKNQLGMWLYGAFPGMLVYCRNGIPNWLLRMLVKYPTPENVAKATTGLAKIKGISQEKAISLKSKAKQNNQSVSAQMAHIISVAAREILHKSELIDQEEKFLTDLHKEDPKVRLLSSIPGIGLSSAVKIIVEIEDIDRFDDVKKMASYFGVHPTFKQSGDGKWGSHMSKRGRGTIRAALYMCALSGMRHNPVLKPIYRRCKEKGMAHNQAIGVLMHKLLRMVYGILRSGKPFDAKIDYRNQRDAREKQESKNQNVKEESRESKRQVYRHQALEVNGPISGRKAVKIKKQTASQSPNEEESTGLPSAQNKHIKFV